MGINRIVQPVFGPAFCARRAVARAPGTRMNELEPRVFVVNGKQLIRKSLADLLLTEDYSVEIFASAAQFLARAPHPGPGCIVFELVRGFDVLAFQKQLREEGRAEQMVFIGGQEHIRIGIEGIKRGAVNFLLKPFRDDELLSALAQALVRSAEVVESRARLAKLTPREFEVFRWIISGLLNKEICDKMGITLRTVKAHRNCVMQKIGVASVVDLLMLALKGGVAPAQMAISSSRVYSARHRQLIDTD
jgi:FixJ family two-component response regulator